MVNLAIREFVESLPVEMTSPHATRLEQHDERALFVSSPIGLGHAMRDVAIARSCASCVPGVQIDWLAQDP